MDEQPRARPLLVILFSGLAFFYFLIFAQFGYLHLLMDLQGRGYLVDFAMLAMGLGGIGGSITTARRFQIEDSRKWILTGFSGSGLVAALSVFVSTVWIHIFIAFAVGMFLGILTVSIVPAIRAMAPSNRVGIWVSLGVGGAYFFCNVPLIFNSSALGHCLFGAFACFPGVIGALYMPRYEPSILTIVDVPSKSPLYLFRTPGVWVVAILFLGLIWLDSAAFYLIQESRILKSHSWGSDSHLWGIAITHFLAAAAGGWMLDRGWLFSLLVGTFLALFLGFWILDLDLMPAGIGASLYVSGVSLYSTALVAFGALVPEYTGSWRISSRSGLVFALGGWFGSAMGIGMARDAQGLPRVFVITVILIIIGCIAMRIRMGAKEECLPV